MNTMEIRHATLWLINATGNRPLPFDVGTLMESLCSVCEKSDKYEDILFIVKQTDMENDISLNEIGEDYGYHESMYEIADICGVTECDT